MDADFSNDTQLELWDLDLGYHTKGGEAKPVASISTDSRSVEPGAHSKGFVPDD